MLVDSHCHLQDAKFDADRADVLSRAREAGVSALTIVGYDLPSSLHAVELADSIDDAYAAIGVHPHDARTLKPHDIDVLSSLADSAKVVAIGEIGLDFYRDLSPRDVQTVAFKQQLGLARSLRLPVVVHSRDADEETFDILATYEREIRPEWPKDRPLGIMHCFAGDLPLALRYIEIGFVISISGAVTYPNAGSTRNVARGIPLRWMAVETDSPHLAPQSQRGRRNEPALLVETVREIAALRAGSFEDIADSTALTVARLLGLGDIGEPTRVTVGETL